MKYLIRSIKYFFQLIIALTLFIVVLSLLHLVDSDPSKIFVNGLDSFWQIAAFVAVFSAIYPRFGYASRRIYVNGSFDQIFPIVEQEMIKRGYKLEKRTGEDLCFRLRSTVARFSRMWEDRITMTRTLNGWSLEGPGKDVIRIANGFNSLPSEDE
ncbi:MAG: hypothetical protein MJY48_01225 [Bacteroidales bacterium]|nr:hypothetical protein [Bacteroidales bacterium]